MNKLKLYFLIQILFLVSCYLYGQKVDTSEIYYQAGIKEFSVRNYKVADSLFSISLKYNKHKDTYFNRAVSREKLNNKKGYCEDLVDASILGDTEALTVFCQTCGKAIDTLYFLSDNSKGDKKHFYYYKVNYTSNYVTPFDINFLNKYVEKEINEKVTKAIEDRYETIFKPDNNGIYYNTETPVEFPGGDEALEAFIKKNLIIPDRIKNNKLQGKVILKFIINEDGSITDLKMLHGMPDCMQCGVEAVKMAKLMPSWIPGTVKGKPVKCQWTLDVKFGTN